MKKARISELKARLSSYLAEVRSGDTITVCERAIPIARLAPLEEDSESLEIREPVRPFGKLTRIRPVRLRKKLNLDKLLRDMRGDS